MFHEIRNFIRASFPPDNWFPSLTEEKVLNRICRANFFSPKTFQLNYSEYAARKTQAI